MTNRFETQPLDFSEESTEGFDKFLADYYGDLPLTPVPPGTPKMYVIFNPDSIQAIHTADMVRRLIPMYRKRINVTHEILASVAPRAGVSNREWREMPFLKKLRPSNFMARFRNRKMSTYDIHLLNVQNAMVPDDKSAVFVWLGLSPRRNVAPEMGRTAWAGCRHITFSETATTMFSESVLGATFSEIYTDHNGWYCNGKQAMADNSRGLSTLKYGMMLEFLARMDNYLGLARAIPHMYNNQVIDFFVQRQHLVSSFETPLISKEILEKSFVETVKAMRALQLPGSTLNIDNPSQALETQIKSVRAQMKATGNVASAMRRKQVVHAYCTKLTEFFWVAKRLIKFEHQHYANITLCNTGVLMSSDLPDEYTMRVNTDLYRSK